MATSILSNRWKLLWTSITNFDFDDGCVKHIDGVIKGSRFTYFVHRVLTLVDQPFIHKFRLRFMPSLDNEENDHIHNWISSALSRGAPHVDVSLSGYGCDVRPLPPALFTSTTLVALKLQGNIVLDFSVISVSLPSLKILHLTDIDTTDNDFNGIIFANSPVLEDVTVDNVKLGDLYDSFPIILSSPSLKKLVLRNTVHDVTYIKINTPALEYLNMQIGLTESSVIYYMPSLIEAILDIVCYPPAHNACQELLHAVSNVEYLTLSGSTMKDMHNMVAAYGLFYPKFINLKRLNVDLEGKNNEVIPKLIKYSKNFEQLSCHELHSLRH